MDTSPHFHKGELDAQERFGNPDIWDQARQTQLLWRSIPEQFHTRLETVPFFFLATSDDKDKYDCSFKGGGKGLVKVISQIQITFPDFDGNGPFMCIQFFYVKFRYADQAAISCKCTTSDSSATQHRYIALL